MSNNVPFKQYFSSYNKVLMLSLIFVFMCFVVLTIYFIVSENSAVFELKEEVAITLNDMMNALLLLSVPFIFGILAASTRVLISELSVLRNYKIIIASGVMSSFSWLGIKSKVFVALLTPYVAKNYEVNETSIQEGSGEFYSMALVAVLVGAFASNLYILISKKVDAFSGERRT